MNNYREMIGDVKPSLSSKALADAVVEKAHKKNRKMLRNASIIAVLIVILMGTTLTVGAVNDWDYSAVTRFFFGGSPNVVEGMHDELNYVVADNTFSGVNFEVTGIYADIDAFLVAIDMIADEPMFSENMPARINRDEGKSGYEIGYTLEPSIRTGYYLLESVYVSDTVMTLVLRVTGIRDMGAIVYNNRDYTVVFTEIISRTVIDGVNYFEHPNSIGDDQYEYSKPFGDGQAVINFTIDKLAMENIVTIHPNIRLASGNIIKEVKISPFKVYMTFDGVEERSQVTEAYLGDRYSDNGYSVTVVNANKAELVLFTSTMFGNTATGESFLTFEAPIANAIDVQNITTIIYRSVEIPVR